MIDKGLWLRLLGIATAGSAAYHIYTGFTRPARKNVLAGFFEVVVSYSLFQASDVGKGRLPAWQR